MPRTLVAILACAALTLASATLIGGSAPARAAELSIRGYVTDGTTGAPIDRACVTLGPPIKCSTYTDPSGYYFFDLSGAPSGVTWDMYFLKRPDYQMVYSEKFVVDGPITFNQTLMPTGVPAACVPAVQGNPTQSAYLPNVTKTFGGAAGWQTPFIVQNTGTATTRLEVTFYRFLNGQCVARKVVDDVAPGTSFADVPNNDTVLPGDTQFAVVVRSFQSPIVTVVNEHAGSGERAEALAYDGAASGANSVFLPNITRRFYGFVTPFIIQNLGTFTTTAVARFVSFDGSAPTVSTERSIDPGKSKFIDPNSEVGLVDGKQYAVTVTAGQPVAVVVNTHLDASWVEHPVAYSTVGVTSGAPELYGAYAAKNASGIGRVSTIVVQNVGTGPITPSLAFLPLGTTGAPQQFTAPAPVPPGGAWAFDPRFTLGTTTPCTTPSATCLGDGEYSFVASAGTSDGRIAAQVNVLSPATAMGYSATGQPAARYFLPNVTRTLCSCASPSFYTGWTTPILLQGVSASGAQLRWFRFSDGRLVTTQNVDIPAHSAIPIDPRTVAGLSDDTQYAVVVDGIGGTVNAIVLELALGGDGAMAYEGFAQADAASLAGPTASPTPAPMSLPVRTPSAVPTVIPFPTVPPLSSPLSLPSLSVQ